MASPPVDVLGLAVASMKQRVQQLHDESQALLDVVDTLDDRADDRQYLLSLRAALRPVTSTRVPAQPKLGPDPQSNVPPKPPVNPYLCTEADDVPARYVASSPTPGPADEFITKKSAGVVNSVEGEVGGVHPPKSAHHHHASPHHSNDAKLTATSVGDADPRANLPPLVHPGHAAPTPRTPAHIRFATLNVLYQAFYDKYDRAGYSYTLNADVRERKFAAAIATKPFDILCLQEFDPAWQRSLGHEYAVASGLRTTLLAVAYSRQLFRKAHQHEVDFGGNKGMLCVVLEHLATRRKVAVVSVHLTFERDRMAQQRVVADMLNRSADYARHQQVRSVIVAGDCNQDIQNLSMGPEWELVTKGVPGTARSPTEAFTAIDHILTLKGGELSARTVATEPASPSGLIPHGSGAAMDVNRGAFSDHAAVIVHFDADTW